MSKINKSQNFLINSFDDIKHQYIGTGKVISENKIGSETEDCLVKKEHNINRLINRNEHEQVSQNLAERGVNITQEGTYAVIETKTNAYPVSEIEKVLLQNDKIEAIKSDVFHSLNIEKCKSSFLPEATYNLCLENAVKNERIQSLIQATSDLYGDNATRHGMMTTSIHVSFEFFDPHHLMNVMRRGTYLAPFLSQICQSDTGYEEGKFFDGNRSAVLRDSYQQAGGAQPYIFQTNDPEKLIEKHVEMVFNTPMLFYYDANGQPVTSHNKKPLNFEQLKSYNLNTQTNYDLAESLKYHDMKLTNIRNGNGERIGTRLENRPASNGSHQHDTMLLVSRAAFLDLNTADIVDDLLEDFGFHREVNANTQSLVLQARDDVKFHDGQYLDINYGCGKMSDFAQEFSSIMTDFYKNTALVNRLDKFNEICETGETDAKRLNRKLLKAII